MTPGPSPSQLFAEHTIATSAASGAWLVMKFGGTSLGSAERLQNVGEIIARAHKQVKKVVVVASALSGSTKEQGSTSQLLTALNLASTGKSFDEPLRVLASFHREILQDFIQADEESQAVEKMLQSEIERAHQLLGAMQVLGESTPRAQDLLVSSGERLSARFLTSQLRRQGLHPQMVDLSLALGEAKGELRPGYFKSIQGQLAQLCTGKQGSLTVATGFFGLIPGGLMRSVGRGYSDFTAALIAAGLGKQQACELQIWKEVDGVYTADPRFVPTARPLRRISPAEAAELTYFGSQVLHPFTMERVTAAGIPIRIMNTFQPQSEGTVITNQFLSDKSFPSTVSAVTAKLHISVATVHSNRMFDAYGFMARVFACLENHRVVVDLVSTSEVSVSFTVENAELLQHAREGLESLGHLEIRSSRAILAIVGEGMRELPGTSGRMFSALGEAGINIEMISQGASEINVSCVVRQQDADRALKLLHHAFLESPIQTSMPSPEDSQ